MSNADHLREPNPWHPITDAVDLKHLGKLGVDEAEPVTGKVNRDWLLDEIADVRANIELVEERFALDADRIAARVAKKKHHLRKWHEKA